MNVEKLEIDQTFDTIVSFENIEHLGNPEMFLEKAKKILKKGGLLIISTPNAKYVSTDNPHHKKDFSLEVLKKVVEKYFNIEKIEGEYLMPIFSWNVLRLFWCVLEKIVPKITLIPCHLGKFYPSKSFILILICSNK